MGEEITQYLVVAGCCGKRSAVKDQMDGCGVVVKKIRVAWPAIQQKIMSGR
jgi:hypothetical protein